MIELQKIDSIYLSELQCWVDNTGIKMIGHDSHPCIEVNTRADAIALRDWLTKAIGDNAPSSKYPAIGKIEVMEPWDEETE
jgi:hypothetical protein